MNAMMSRHRRAQRVIDLVIALHSEILAGVVANRRQLTPDEAKYARASPTPFATPDETDFVFDSDAPGYHILPADVIHSVVQYYQRRQAIESAHSRISRDPVSLLEQTQRKRASWSDCCKSWSIRKSLAKWRLPILPNLQ